MVKRSSLPSSRRHVMIYDEDWEFLRQHFGKGTEANLGEGIAVRELVHKRIMGQREKMNQALDKALQAPGKVQEVKDE